MIPEFIVPDLTDCQVRTYSFMLGVLNVINTCVVCICFTLTHTVVR